MGYAKYHEDDQRIIDDRKYFLYGNNYIEKTITFPPTFNCPYCNKTFYDREKLNTHIKEEHNSISKLLILNQQIVQKDAYIKQITSLVIVRYDLSEPIYVDDMEINGRNDIDITELAIKKLKSIKRLQIKVGNRDWTISLLTSEFLDLSKMESVVMQWSCSTQNRKAINRQNVSEFNLPENHCLDGFYNYFLACVTEPALKIKRYEDAYNILSEFFQIVPLAKFVLKVIAFKLNWVNSIRTLCGDNDLFKNIYDFFTDSQSENAIDKFTGEKQVFIEDDLENSILAILAYQSSHYDKLQEYLNQFDKNTLLNMQDSNLRDKIYLLKARIAIKRGDTHEARRLYEEIATPFFISEYEQFLKNMRVD